jgi:tRNA(Ile)-lysidine synthase
MTLPECDKTSSRHTRIKCLFSQLPVSLLTNFVETSWPSDLWRDVHVLVAVSGGPDSMALLRAILEIKERRGGRGSVTAAHIHHGLHRAADEDAAWLAEQLVELKISHRIHRVDSRAEAARQGDGLEAAARSLRYAALQPIAEELGARYVATGHTADDQVETVLHRILRGTGIEGLAGIPRYRPLGDATTLVRPLLNASRQDVLTYLTQVGQAYRHDPTNDEATYTRNRIRRELLPLLRSQYNPATNEAILRLARQAEEIGAVLKAQASALLDKAVVVSDKEIEIAAAQLAHEPDAMAREVLRAAWRLAGWPEQNMSDADWRRLSALLHADASCISLPSGVEAGVSRRVLRLRRAQDCRCLQGAEH